MSGSSAQIAAEYFDGRSARAHAVQLQWAGQELLILGANLHVRVAASRLIWPERTRHGPRVLQLQDGGSVHCGDAAAWDAWARAAGHKESIVVTAQQSWRWVWISVASLVVLAAALYLWGIPWAGRAVVAATPQSVDQRIGESVLEALDAEVLKPSALPLEQQQRLRAAFERATAALPAGTVPDHRLLFRSGRMGPNAFALPGGTMVITDDLVRLVQGDEAVIVGVLGHELGHVLHRHGLRLLVQVGAVGALSGLLLGDFSTLLAGAPVLLGQAGYSRDAEREADAHAVTVLKAAGLSPAVMVSFFEKVAARNGPVNAPVNSTGTKNTEPEDAATPGAGLAIAIASHPADAERIRYFRDAAAR